MADTIPAYKEVAVVFSSALISGVYLTSLGFCYRWLFFDDEGWRLRKRINWMIVTATSAIFLLNLVYPVLSLRRVMEMVKGLEDNPDSHYKTAAWDRLVKCTAANLTALVADCVLIYRCWIVYKRSLALIAFPVVLWLGGIACTILEVYFEIAHTLDPEIGSQAWRGVNTSLGPGFALIPFLASTVLLNCYSTYMLIRRINTVIRKGESTIARQLQYMTRILAESGILYLSITVALLASWFTPNNIAIQTLSMINNPVIGIAFNLVLIRSARMKATGESAGEEEYSEDQTSDSRYHHSLTVASV